MTTRPRRRQTCRALASSRSRSRPVSTSPIDERLVTVKGPKGTLTPHRRRARSPSRTSDGVLEVKRPDDEREQPFPARPDPHPDQQHGRRRDRGLREEARDRRRGLPRPVQGPDPAGVPARLLATRSRSTPPRASPSPSRARPGSASRASTSSWSARSPPTSASCASPSPTRARAFATRASTSAARSERLVSDHGDLAVKHRKHTAARTASRLRRQVRGRKKISGTAERPRLVVTRSSQAHHRAGRRRPGRQDARVRLDHGGRPARPRRRQDRQGQARSASSSPSAPRPPASRAWSSTAPATSTTVASRPWPTAPARAA